ncbi:MAG: nucleotidyl transferase AbiEii/AbiGii toxin family protein [Bacteroidales bacterium]|nr:nucleotidyl transferase AbiEii/AbiGii toxin family protein [Bacteroidales bacterium]
MPFYLTGGTALVRFYLNHRYSEDLDFFVNKRKKYN